MKKLAFIAMMSVFTSHAQWEPRTSMFWNSYSNFNPANAGLDHSLFLSMYTKSLPAGNTPINTGQVIAENYRSELHGGLGIGYVNDLYVSKDMIRDYLNNTQKLNLNYSYVMKISELHKLSFGIGLGLIRRLYRDSNWNYLTYYEGGGVDFSINIGIAYRYKNLKLGASGINMIEPKFGDKAAKHESSRTQYRAFNALLDYKFRLYPNLQISPKFQITRQRLSTTVQMGITATMHDVFWIGVSKIDLYFPDYALMAGFRLWGKFNVGYAYDHYSNSWGPLSKGSHEAYLTFTVD